MSGEVQSKEEGDALSNSLRKISFETEINLQDKGLSSLKGIKEMLDENTNSVVGLNLSKNCFNSWDTIVEIVRFFPNLKTLNVSGNKSLASIGDRPFGEVLKMKEAFSSVTSIVMREIGYNWGEVMTCVREMFSDDLQKLDLRQNQVSFISSPTMNALDSLQNVNLSYNPIEDWAQVVKLASLRSLETLILIKCGIKSISFLPQDPSKLTDQFLQLKKLDLAQNEISSWKDILELTRLQCLKDINVKWNPITAAGESFMDSSVTCIAIFGTFAGIVNELEVREGLVRDAESFLADRIHKKLFTDTEYPVIEWIIKSKLLI